MTNEEWAKVLDEKIKAKNPRYWVRWNPDIQIWIDDGSFGVFEIGADDGVHYRRKTPECVVELIG